MTTPIRENVTLEASTADLSARIPRRPGASWLSDAALLHLLGICLAVALWAMGAQLLPEGFEGFGVGPTAGALTNLLGSDYFWNGVSQSLARLVGGLGIATALGIPIGLSVGYVRVLHDLTYVLFQFLRMISPLSWMPVAVIVFGVGTAPVVFLIAIAAVWPIILNTAHGVHQVERTWMDVVRTLGGGHLALLRRVVVPAILPDILTGMRVALGVGWIVLVPAEMLGVASGLGYMILDFRDVVDYASVTAVILVIGLLGYLADEILRTAMKQVVWRS